MSVAAVGLAEDDPEDRHPWRAAPPRRRRLQNLKESCGTSFGQNTLENFTTTNKAVPGLIAPTLSENVYLNVELPRS
ncbi:MAG TPA: hypothetical protein VGC63_09680 [Solirubrobacterales bacterium]